MQTAPKLRVLVVIDFRPWALGTIAAEIARLHPQLNVTICSDLALESWVKSTPYLARCFDLVHFLVPTSSALFMRNFRGQIPCITTLHHITSETSFDHFHLSDISMVVSRDCENYLLNHGFARNKVVRVALGVNTNEFHPLSSELRHQNRLKRGFASADLVIGFCAKNSRDRENRKGSDRLWKNLTLLKNKKIKFALALHGPGWQNLVRHLNAASIQYHWQVFSDRTKTLNDFYSCLDIYWMTSRIEGGPLPLLEAMACGICALSTPVGMAEEVIAHEKNGILIRDNFENSFADISEGLAQNRPKIESLGLNARQTIVDNFSFSKSLQDIPKLYQQAVINFNASYGATSHVKEALSPRLINQARVKDELAWVLSLLGAGAFKPGFEIWIKLVKTFPLSKVWFLPFYALKKLIRKNFKGRRS